MTEAAEYKKVFNASAFTSSLTKKNFQKVQYSAIILASKVQKYATECFFSRGADVLQCQYDSQLVILLTLTTPTQIRFTSLERYFCTQNAVRSQNVDIDFPIFCNKRGQFGVSKRRSKRQMAKGGTLSVQCDQECF